MKAAIQSEVFPTSVQQILITDLPHISAVGKIKVLLEKFLPKLNGFIQECQTSGGQAVPNPEYIELKGKLASIIEVIDDSRSSAEFNDLQSFAYFHELTYHQANHVAGKIKRAEKLQEKDPEDLKAGKLSTYPERAKFQDAPYLLAHFIKISRELQRLHEALEALRPHITKRKVKTQEERDADFWKPLPDAGAVGRVAKILKAMTDPLRDAYAILLFEQMVAAVEDEIANRRMRAVKRRDLSWGEILLQKVGEDWDFFNGSYRALKPDYKATLKIRAEEEAKMIQQAYLWKNLDKLTLIIDGKNNLKGMPIILKSSVSSNGFMGEVRFDFEDGSFFTCKNQVIVNRSEYGKYFNQFPTTFHGVRLVNGMMIKKASEKSMVEDFAGVGLPE